MEKAIIMKIIKEKLGPHLNKIIKQQHKQKIRMKEIDLAIKSKRQFIIIIYPCINKNNIIHKLR